MASQLVLRQQLEEKKAQLGDIVHQISAINLKICKLSQKFTKEAGKIQKRLSKVQFSRPRGNPANQWPHCPMTNRVQAFYQSKERKETQLRQNKDLLKQTFDHSKAILTYERLVFENEKRDIGSQIRQIRIQLNLPINLDNLY